MAFTTSVWLGDGLNWGPINDIHHINQYEWKFFSRKNEISKLFYRDNILGFCPFCSVKALTLSSVKSSTNILVCYFVLSSNTFDTKTKVEKCL